MLFIILNTIYSVQKFFFKYLLVTSQPFSIESKIKTANVDAFLIYLNDAYVDCETTISSDHLFRVLLCRHIPHLSFTIYTFSEINKRFILCFNKQAHFISQNISFQLLFIHSTALFIYNHYMDAHIILQIKVISYQNLFFCTNLLKQLFSEKQKLQSCNLVFSIFLLTTITVKI